MLDQVIGPVVYSKEIPELAGLYLASYEVVRLWVELSEQEKSEYLAAREFYLQFLKDKQIIIMRRNSIYSHDYLPLSGSFT